MTKILNTGPIGDPEDDYLTDSIGVDSDIDYDFDCLDSMSDDCDDLDMDLTLG